MRAEFIGKTSMGFITGQIYTIETACKMVRGVKPVERILYRVYVYTIKTLRRGVRIAVWKRY